MLLSCGEASGDLYAGALTRELRALAPGIDVAGLRRAAVRRAPAGGCSPTIAAWRSPGSPRSIAKVPQSLAAHAARWSRRPAPTRPDALVVIDFSGLQLPARAAHQEARHPGRLLHQPADLGVAARPAEDDSRQSRTACS